MAEVKDIQNATNAAIEVVNEVKEVTAEAKTDKSKLVKRLSNPAFYIAILGSVKLILDVFGVKIIDDSQINAVANGISGIVAIVGVVLNYE